MSVINGQNADATTFNSAFASKSADNTLQGKQTLARPGSGSTVVDTQQAINDVIASDALKIPTAEKGVANGVATLDATTKVPVAQIPDLTASKITDFNTSADARITLQKGAPSGIAPLDASSKIDSSYLPSYVDDVVEVANYASLPVTGETGKIYVTLDTNKTYRWSGSVYVQIGQPIASTSDVPEGTNLYFTPARVADKQIGIQFQDQGSNLGTTATVDTIDFIGAGITATRASNKVTVEVTATGSGGGSKNYFSQSSINPDFETGSVSPWQVMTTTWSGNAPTNAPTPGAVVTTFYTNIVSPLAGTTSAMMTKGLGVGQYEGVMSGVFTIDREDLAKVLYGSFAYEVSGTASANFDVSGTSSQTLEIWVYNVNANQWIQPAGFRGINQFTGPGQVTFSFQTDSLDANNQYRICLIIRQNTGGTWNLKVDDFKVGPQAIVLGTPVTDWQDFSNVSAGTLITSTGTNPTYGTVSVNRARWRRVGDSAEIEWNFAQTSNGTNGTGVYLFNLPAPLVLDSSYTFNTNVSNGSTSLSAPNVVGTFYANFEAGANKSLGIGEVIPYSNNKLKVYLSLMQETGAGDSAFWGPYYEFGISPLSITLIAKVKIQGWSANVQTSSDTDTRLVSFSGTQSSQAVTANTTNIAFTATKDSHGSWSSNQYTVPVSGDYMVSASLMTSGAGSLDVYKNGSRYGSYLGTSSSAGGFSVGGSALLTNLIAGDIITIRYTQSVTLTNGYMSINRLSGPSVITATETVAYRGGRNGGNYSLSSGSSVLFIPNSTMVDTHNAMNTSTGIYTIPVSGIYEIIGRLAHFTTTGSGNINISITAGSEQAYTWSAPDSANNNYRSLIVTMIKRLNAGDTVSLYAGAGGVSSTVVGNDAAANGFSIKRIGS